MVVTPMWFANDDEDDEDDKDDDDCRQTMCVVGGPLTLVATTIAT
jgi:hypothetical protein